MPNTNQIKLISRMSYKLALATIVCILIFSWSASFAQTKNIDSLNYTFFTDNLKGIYEYDTAEYNELINVKFKKRLIRRDKKLIKRLNQVLRDTGLSFDGLMNNKNLIVLHISDSMKNYRVKGSGYLNAQIRIYPNNKIVPHIYYASRDIADKNRGSWEGINPLYFMNHLLPLLQYQVYFANEFWITYICSYDVPIRE